MPTPADSESAWISRVVVHDDQCAFTALVQLHQEPVRRFLRRLCGGDRARADDLAQETFWKAYRHIASFRGEGKFLSWLFRIAWQLFVSQQRKNRGHNIAYEAWMDAHHVVEDASTQIVEQHTLDQLLHVLRADERAAIMLHYRHGLTHSEIAETLEQPLGTVKTLVRRARQKLRNAFEATSKQEKP